MYFLKILCVSALCRAHVGLGTIGLGSNTFAFILSLASSLKYKCTDFCATLFELKPLIRRYDPCVPTY